MREFYFRIPCSMSLRVRAEDEVTALQAAEAWQAHAGDWDEFTTDEEPADHMDADELPAGAKIVDATVWVESSGVPMLSKSEPITQPGDSAGDPRAS